MAKVLGFSINIQGTEQAIETAEQLRRAIAEVQKELKKTGDVDAIKQLEKELVELKAAQGNVNQEIRDQVRIRRAELAAVDDTGGAYTRMSKTLNDLRKRYKDMAAAGQEFTKEAIDIRTEITALDARLKEIDASVGQFQRNVGGYSQALSQFFPRITQTFGDVRAGFANTAEAAGALNKSLGVLLLAVTVFNEVAQGIESAVEASKEFNAVQRRLAQITTDSTEVLEENTGTIIALSRTYQAESKDIINAANAVAKEFGIEYSEALTLIEAGFRKGANAQGDFLDQLREYPAQFAAAGGSAASFFDILIRAQKEGIYSDKGIDAVKEFGLRIREQTKATKEALEGAFGERFTSRLFKGINNGSINTVQALKQVTGGLRDTQLTAAQTQKVIADVFGGPGEDAGLRFLQLLADVDEATQDVTKSTNEYESQQAALFEANERLAQSQARLAEFTVKTGNEFALLRTNFKVFVAGAATEVLNFFNSLPATLAGVEAAVKALSSSVRASLTFGLAGDFENPLKAYNKAFKAAIREIKEQDEEAVQQQKEFAEQRLNTEIGLQQRLQELRSRRAQAQIGSAEFKQLTREIEAIEKQLTKAARGAGDKTGKSFIDGSIAAIQQKANELQKAITEAVAGSDKQKNLIAAYNKQVKLLEDAIAQRNRLEFEGIRAQQTAALQSIESLSANLQQVQIESNFARERLLAEGARINRKRFREEIRQNQERIEALKKQEKEDRLRRREAILAEIQTGTQLTFDLINAIAAAANQRRNEIFQQQISDTEERINQLEDRANQATGIRRRLIEQSIAAERKLLQEQTRQAEAEQKRQRKAEKRNALIASIIQGALAVQRALANPPGPPFTIPQAIATGIFAAIQTATIAAQPLATGGVVGISGRRVTDRQNMPTRGNGDNVLATVKRGEVVLNQRQQAALGGAQTFRAIRVPGFATGGMASPAIGAPNLPSLPGDNMKAIAAIDRKTDAINARLDRLRAYVVTEDIARDMREGESIEIKATL